MWKFQTFWQNDPVISTAFRWYQKSPGFVRNIATFVDTEDEFIKELSGSINFYGTIDGEILGVVHGEQKTPEIVEGHLFCSKSVDLDFATALVTYSKNEALKHYKVVDRKSVV